MFDLESEDIPGRYWHGLDSLMSAFSEGEPLAKHPGVGPKIAEWLLQRGLIEVVENPRYGDHFGPCYRVTALGHKAFNRGKRAKRPDRIRFAELQPRLRTLEPKFQTLKPKIKSIDDTTD
jgi:hypothetical protein